MGSQKICDVKPNGAMAEHKKSIKELLKKPFQALFKDKKERKKNAEAERSAKTTPVEEILEDFKKLEIERQREEESNDEEDELKNFEYKIIKEERSSARVDSHSSEDSGFADKCSDAEEEGKDEERKGKEEKGKTKTQKVVLIRGPTKIGTKAYAPHVDPYTHRQINQINRHTFSGGQVIVNQNIQPPIDEVLKGVDINVRRFQQKSCQEKEIDWHIAQEYISDFERKYDEEPSSSDPLPFDIDNFIKDSTEIYHDPKTSVFLTPPRSETSLSPISDSNNAYYPTEYTMSPDMSSDYEKYQEITPLEEYPSCIADIDEKVELKPKESKERASMTMKQFKDMQKEIAGGFSKMDCCQEIRRPCLDVFKEHIRRLDVEERKGLSLKVAMMDMEHLYGVLQHVLLRLSSAPADDDDVQLALLTLLCEKVLALDPAFFVSEQGLGVLKAAVFRCTARPLITRYLVQCIRVVTRGDGYKSTKGHVFHEVDAVGDTVVSACARAGDTHAAVLAELLRARPAPADTPLFDVHHVNNDGYTALHVACMEHDEASPHLHVVHVLLQHGHADLWKGDIKGGDTAVHVAVNAAGCALPLLLLLFRPLPRADWKRLAHAPNRSSVTPLEYARSAIKSASRQNYPVEVLDFLKKCR